GTLFKLALMPPDPLISLAFPDQLRCFGNANENPGGAENVIAPERGREARQSFSEGVPPWPPEAVTRLSGALCVKNPRKEHHKPY
ncbi:MAG: hypothetical protein RDU30_18130, partial [Desulfovibrionaceae bacterium]|nr:hypothetical protein [Desulfovibrionaceae bacterium]